ncbi:hypothetical protein BKA58DRAFT_420910 [Alternaria rosae]|uniref:uncharacterized protein n=1 Tax=Alternaria rosae TaxID=1187941 RepID=UPI001E8E8922|nr:uncharacterized protein BKA58DRAFT_420910 [Alternaria rosae]KAH6870348.1 hypothetical protein BKA58DRAFT_420910 [Alternaria rosae]
MAVNEPTYQFALTVKECEFIRAIRAVEQSISPSEQPRLRQKLELHVRDENGDSLGSCDVSPENMVLGFVGASAAFLKELAKEPDQRKKDLAEVDEGVHIDDRDSVLGSQTQDTAADSLSRIMNARLRRGRHSGNLASRHDYPGVTIVIPKTKAEEGVRGAHATEKPKGVKQMIIEVEETEVSENPELESSLRNTYPWALIESKPGPDISRKRARPDPVKHIEDFAAYVLNSPSDDEFGYHYPVGDWDHLTCARKFEIAHARAIQHYHGRLADDGGCSQCAEDGHQCRVYLPQLENPVHIDFGHTCQNCRLRHRQCDLPATVKLLPSTPTGPAALRIDTRNIHHRGETVDTPPLMAATPGSLASRMTAANGSRLNNEEDDGHTPISGDHRLPMMEFAEQINLFQGCRNPKVKSVIYSMYGLLKKHDKVEPFGKHPLTLDQYYQNLTTLYIVTYLRKEYHSAYIVLLRFQNTDYHETGELPTIENVVRAFECLLAHAPLCRWIVILYSFLWETQYYGSWDVFLNTHPSVKSKVHAVAKLLFGISWIRDPFTTGGDTAVRQQWCAVHIHSTGTREQQEACENMKSEARYSPRIGEKRRSDDGSPVLRPYKAARGGRGRGRSCGSSR